MRITRTSFRRLAHVSVRRSRRGDRGMATAEYAIGTCAAAGFGGLLFKLLTGDGVANLLGSLLEKALEFVF